MKSLTDLELSEIKALEMSHKLDLEKIKVARLEAKVFEHQQTIIIQRIADKKNEAESLRLSSERSKLELREKIKLIEKKKRLAPGWGFNPETGEITQGEN